MRRQLDLNLWASSHIKPPPDADQPRLWVRRLVVWKETGGEVVRDISLRPGLNIIWSPDPTDDGGEQGALGHGAGKTLFCRLLRYCLGEDRFAAEGIRHDIADAFRDGLVGAEVVLDGVTWAAPFRSAPFC